MDTAATVVTKIEPKHDFVVVKVDRDEDLETAGGIIIPAATLQNKKTMTGEIVAIGPGRENMDGSGKIPMQCKLGDHVILAVFIGYPVAIREGDAPSDLVDYVIVKDYDVMGIVSREEQRIIRPR